MFFDFDTAKLNIIFIISKILLIFFFRKRKKMYPIFTNRAHKNPTNK